MSLAFVIHLLAGIFRGADAAIFVLCAFIFVCDWVKRCCYLPGYIHVMAGITFIGSWVLLRWMTYCYPPVSPPSKWFYAGTALFLALIVYIVFVLYGGAGAAWEARRKQEQKSLATAGLSKKTLRQIAREATRARCVERLHLGGQTTLVFALSFVNAALFGFIIYGFLPLWAALLAGTLLWLGATALFLVSQTFGSVELIYKHVALSVLLLTLLYEK